MDAEKSCPNCRAAMKLETKTPRFLSYECPKCAFVLIEVAKEDAPPSSARIHSIVHGGHLHNDYCFAEDGDADTFMRRTLRWRNIRSRTAREGALTGEVE